MTTSRSQIATMMTTKNYTAEIAIAIDATHLALCLGNNQHIMCSHGRPPATFALY
jgi:hypothetical protein